MRVLIGQTDPVAPADVSVHRLNYPVRLSNAEYAFMFRRDMTPAARTAATKVGKAAARSWLKLVPILNVASTVYDIYDLASTSVDAYKQIQTARESFSGDVYSVRPDVAVMGENGQLKDIYDFKFDGDQWQPGQEELYNKDLRASGSKAVAKSVNSKDCGCNGLAFVPRTGR